MAYPVECVFSSVKITSIYSAHLDVQISKALETVNIRCNELQRTERRLTKTLGDPGSPEDPAALGSTERTVNNINRSSLDFVTAATAPYDPIECSPLDPSSLGAVWPTLEDILTAMRSWEVVSDYELHLL